MIVDIALGIVLAVAILSLWPLILALGVILLALFLAAIIGVWLYTNGELEAAFIILGLTGTVLLVRHLLRRLDLVRKRRVSERRQSLGYRSEL